MATRIADRVASNAVPHWSNGTAPATANTAAADTSRRGTEAFARQSPEGTVEALAAVRAATEADRGFSEARAHLAEAPIY